VGPILILPEGEEFTTNMSFRLRYEREICPLVMNACRFLAIARNDKFIRHFTKRVIARYEAILERLVPLEYPKEIASYLL
jgi:hypothetical protein